MDEALKHRVCLHARVILMFMSGLLMAACSDFFVDEEKTLQLARDYLGAREFNAAGIELRNTLQENPDNAEARYLLASINLDYGDYATAAKEYRRALSAGWDEALVNYGLARALVGAADYQGVIDIGMPAADWPASIRAGLLSQRAVALAGHGRREEAIETLQAAREADKDALAVLRTGIQLAIVDRHFEDAAAQLQHALELYPDSPGLLLLQASLLADSDAGLAATSFRKVVEMDPPGFISANGRMARLLLSQLQIVDRQFDQAEQLLKPLYRRDRHDAFMNYLGGVIAFQREDYQRAGELLLKVLKFAPEHNPTRLLFGTVNYAEGNFEQAAYFLGKYIAAVPDNMDARKLLARSYILLGRDSEAERLLQPMLARQTNDAELLALVAVSELNRGKTAAGIAGLEQAVQAEPGSLVLRSELARAYIEAGETAMAIDELRALLAKGGEQQQTRTLLILAHLRAGEHAEAITQVLGMVVQDPDDPAIQTLAGNVFAASGDLAEARIYLERVRAETPGFLPAILSLASLEEQEGNYPVAATFYQQAVDTDTKSVVPYLALARISEQQGDTDGLLDWLEQALEHAPDDLQPRMFLAEYYLRAGKPVTARTYIREALELAPGMPELHILSGRAYMAEKDYRKALQPLQLLLKTEPDSQQARILLGECYLQLDQYDDARRELQQVIEQYPDNVSASGLLANLEIRAGNLERALDYSRRIKTTYPELFLGYELAGDVQMAGRRFDEAEAEYDKAWERMQSSALAIKRAENAILAGNTGKGITGLEAWLQAHPDDIQVTEHLGTTLQVAGNKPGAIAVYKKIIAASPENAVALNNLAGLYLEDNRPEALPLAKRAWQAARENPGVQDTYGWALVKNGQTGLGLELLEQAAKSLPDIPEVRYHHAAALYQAGSKEAARKTLRELLESGLEFEGREDAERLLQE